MCCFLLLDRESRGKDLRVIEQQIIVFVVRLRSFFFSKVIYNVVEAISYLSQASPSLLQHYLRNGQELYGFRHQIRSAPSP